ncbi:PadR family transcriptional regulator, partial [Georgenia sp. 10Sc9-8]|nr:PadR family transcriptional regulator [Georgenia halotolerans]
MSEPESPWPSEWLRGVLSLCVLRTLADGPTYGYSIALR